MGEGEKEFDEREGHRVGREVREIEKNGERDNEADVTQRNRA